jgi:DNA-binding XRE family transcriptional regulator
MEERNLTDDALAAAIGLDRKTILRYRHCQGVPRLEVVATIYAYFGEKKISIDLCDLGGSDNG